MNSLTFSYVIKGLTVAQSDWIIIRTLLSLERKIVFSLSSDSDYKYQLISSHSARRSFATINVLRNIPRSQILRATGHSSENAFNRYICYNDES